MSEHSKGFNQKLCSEMFTGGTCGEHVDCYGTFIAGNSLSTENLKRLSVLLS